ncbi:FAD binding domain-containing protein [Acetonema longum]|uniref:Molybdopterin dehydrogenase, FAD-binding protein n=1 Tax=Acetonema longum DSM 6540 TaxID=1009370 RepID=F7NJ07_9FIRM|nr:FAD binding domain-containing protein [Acetonema longum]EGO64004.1 molybdopterin dehydrogenase, FAD-binding protein [Acetonema longum DSM 6540]
MLTVLNLVQPATLEEAYQALTSNRSNAVLGGCAFLRLSPRKIPTGIDLSRLDLQYIKDTADRIEIGAMTTLRDLEVHPAAANHFNGALVKAVSQIIGVQFRNVATVGATVFSKYGFSDLITALLVLDTEVELFKGGRMPLAAFLEQPLQQDILVRIYIHKNGRKAAYQSLRNSASDYPILTAAASVLDKDWRVVVGARPQRAMEAAGAVAILSRGVNEDTIAQAAETAAAELSFGANLRGTAEYRQAMCRVLVKRAIEETERCEASRDREKFKGFFGLSGSQQQVSILPKSPEFEEIERCEASWDREKFKGLFGLSGSQRQVSVLPKSPKF